MPYKIHFLDTSFATQYKLQSDINNTLKYLVNNRDIVLLPSDVDEICKTKTLSMTPITKLFEIIYQNQLINEFALVHMSNSTDSIPELLTLPDIVLDTKQLNNASNVLNSIKEFKNKVIIDTTQYVKKTRDGIISLTDIGEFHRQIIRGALVSSYYNTNDDIWLNPYIVKFISETYAKSISSVIAKLYNLTIAEQNTISIALAWFYLQRMTDNHEELLCQCDFLGSKINIKQAIEMFKDYIGRNGMMSSLDDISKLISLIGPQNMRNFNTDIYTRLMGKSGTSYINMRIAIEYPPYWVYQLLIALSGIKINLSFLLQKNKLLKPANEFFMHLMTCRQFIPSVKFAYRGTESIDRPKLINYPTLGKFMYSERHHGWVSMMYQDIVLESTYKYMYLTKRQKRTYLSNISKTPDICQYPLVKILSRKLSIDESAMSSVTMTHGYTRISQNGTIYKSYTLQYKDKTCSLVMSIDKDDNIEYSTDEFLADTINNRHDTVDDTSNDTDTINNEENKVSVFEDDDTDDTISTESLDIDKDIEKIIQFVDDNEIINKLMSTTVSDDLSIRDSFTDCIHKLEILLSARYNEYCQYMNTTFKNMIPEVYDIISDRYHISSTIDIMSPKQYTASIKETMLKDVFSNTVSSSKIHTTAMSFIYVDMIDDDNANKEKCVDILSKVNNSFRKYNTDYITLKIDDTHSYISPTVNMTIYTGITKSMINEIKNILK